MDPLMHVTNVLRQRITEYVGQCDHQVLGELAELLYTKNDEDVIQFKKLLELD